MKWSSDLEDNLPTTENKQIKQMALKLAKHKIEFLKMLKVTMILNIFNNWISLYPTCLKLLLDLWLRPADPTTANKQSRK